MFNKTNTNVINRKAKVRLRILGVNNGNFMIIFPHFRKYLTTKLKFASVNTLKSINIYR